MARLVGIGIFLWVIYATMSYAWAMAPQPDDDGPRRPPPIDEIQPEPESESESEPARIEDARVEHARTEDAPVALAREAVAEDQVGDAALPGFSFAGRDEAALAAEQATAVVEDLVEAKVEAADGLDAERLLALADDRPDVLRTSWPSGVYAVGPSDDPRVAARDRDHRAKNPRFVEDERLASMTVPHYVRSIQGELAPGTYATDPTAHDCTYQLWRVMRKSRTEEVIGEDQLSSGRLLVTIDGTEPDWFTATVGCGGWHQWVPRADRTAPIVNGDYGPGDLAPGVWDVPEGCLWEKVAAFRGAQLHDVVSNGQGPTKLVIESDEPVGLRLRSCQAEVTLRPSSPVVSVVQP